MLLVVITTKNKIMASFECIGFINTVKFLQDSVLLFIDEYHKGYRKNDGTIVEEKYVTFKIIFKAYFKKYFSTHFSNGVLVKVKGEVLPYAVEHGKAVDGISILGQTCDMFSYPRAGVKQEQKMIKESQMNDNETPNLEAFNTPDF